MKMMQLWKLDTETDGEDEILQGTYGQVERDILHFHDLQEMPAHWTLTKLELAAVEFPTFDHAEMAEHYLRRQGYETEIIGVTVNTDAPERTVNAVFRLVDAKIRT